MYNGKFFEEFDKLIEFDEREEGKVLHKLIDVLFVIISGFMCGYDKLSDIQLWATGKMNIEWFKKYVELLNGIPSLSTMRIVLRMINAEEFENCFISWIKSSINLPPKDTIAVDGKTMKGSKQKNINKKATHIVNALCHSHGLVMGQVKTEEKSNEITAIPELLDKLFIEGCIVTIDAMGAQHKIVDQIVNKNHADYVLGLKENQENLFNKTKEYYENLEDAGVLGDLRELHRENEKKEVLKKEELENESNELEEFPKPDKRATQTSQTTTSKHNVQLNMLETIDKNHGRDEKRTYYYSTDIDEIKKWAKSTKKEWTKLTGIGMVVREIQNVSAKTPPTKETSFYIGSVDNVNDFAGAVRYHWAVESMHWVLDVTFKDDDNKTRMGNGAENMATIKRIVFNAIKSEKQMYPKKSIGGKRVIAAINFEYRDHLIDLSLNK